MPSWAEHGNCSSPAKPKSLRRIDAQAVFFSANMPPPCNPFGPGLFPPNRFIDPAKRNFGSAGDRSGARLAGCCGSTTRTRNVRSLWPDPVILTNWYVRWSAPGGSLHSECPMTYVNAVALFVVFNKQQTNTKKQTTTRTKMRPSRGFLDHPTPQWPFVGPGRSHLRSCPAW